MNKLSLPAKVEEALIRLNDAGHEAWLVGGVRDLILGRPVRDWDITTSALPEEIKHVFSDCGFNGIGEKFGTVVVHFGSIFLDITTFRKEDAYLDHRHPSQVHFTKNLFDDLKRRDFTFNAIVYHPKKGFHDFFCGKRDLKKKLVRAIGDADQRFRQDAVRILRALRFASVLGFEIEEKTAQALHRNRELVASVAPERALPEITRMLCGKNVSYVLTEFSDVLGVLIPEILPTIGFSQHSPFHQYDVWMHTVHAVSASDPIPEIRLSLLFHDISKPGCLTFDSTGRGHFYAHPKKSSLICNQVLTRMKFPSKQIKLITLLVSLHDSHPNSEADVKHLLAAVGEEHFFTLIRIMEADTIAHSKWTVKKRLQQIHHVRDMAKHILDKGDCFSLKTLSINGSDLERSGLEGKNIGELLRLTLQKVISGEWKNEKTFLLSQLEKNNWQIS